MSPIQWRKSSYSTEAEGSNCVELGQADAAILLRESDDPCVVIATTPAALRGLVARIKTGGFDHMAG
ncbi:hypothetical protein GCM10009548_02920 [Streptomyces malaysiensis subsp. malaysiensis]|uniref:DUF397 domain-containing protein n=2 Tax=Streptomyces TaxID=1883 RepID=A0ABX6W438_STRMQ|nr:MULTISPECIES: DUF397 domain-containing protein [Streptomyces]MYU09552.1 DUF397 domain-containing protein [Streptomyces sp. SID8361]MCM3809208.1 DUF397 domain-containing protein [Streptomyces sp. DR7-3]QPI56260.1 DUF397 domain-containing protein [Streptomyces solisilvae]UHH17738.1 DUF397 domain-containing protein [Streptomyces sp. HNM0561]SCF62951.1 protein of unknown function [Streptomyces sp. MnatMP-M27]